MKMNHNKMDAALTQFYKNNMATPQNIENRRAIIKEIEMIMQRHIQSDIHVKLIGSSAYDLSIKDGDIDIVLLISNADSVQNYKANHGLYINSNGSTHNFFDDFHTYIRERNTENLQNGSTKYKKNNEPFNCRVKYSNTMLQALNTKYTLPINQEILFYISTVLQQNLFAVEQVISSATVPIIKLYSPRHGQHIDMSLNQIAAVENTHIIKEVLDKHTFIKCVIGILKLFCESNKIKCTYTCTLSSYAITLMTIFYFQNIDEIPPLFAMERKNGGKHGISQYLKGFFHFYSYIYNYETDVVSIRRGSRMLKSEKNFKHTNTRYNLVLCIEDPVIRDFNVTRTVNAEGLNKITELFKNVHRDLMNGDISKLICKP